MLIASNYLAQCRNAIKIFNFYNLIVTSESMEEQGRSCVAQANDLVVRTQSGADAVDTAVSESMEHVMLDSIEKIVNDRFQSISDVLVEQNRLLREVVSALQTLQGVKPEPHGVHLHPHARKNDTFDADGDLNKEISNDKNYSVLGELPQNGSKSHRLRHMSMASDNDVDLVRIQEAAVKDMSNYRTDEKSVRFSHDTENRHKSLQQRKREFAKRTASTVSNSKSASRDRSRLAVAAAKREMERERARMEKMRQLEREESNSIGSWIGFVIVVILGVSALVLGVVANFYRHQGDEKKPEL
jgi:hypothetical protein